MKILFKARFIIVHILLIVLVNNFLHVHVLHRFYDIKESPQAEVVDLDLSSAENVIDNFKNAELLVYYSEPGRVSKLFAVALYKDRTLITVKGLKSEELVGLENKNPFENVECIKTQKISRIRYSYLIDAANGVYKDFMPGVDVTGHSTRAFPSDVRYKGYRYLYFPNFGRFKDYENLNADLSVNSPVVID